MKEGVQVNRLNGLVVEAEDMVCMLMIPTVDALDGEDVSMVDERRAWIHSAALILDKANVIGDDGRSGDVHATDIGRIASHQYVSHASMSVYDEHLCCTREEIDWFRLSSLSHEFRQLRICQEERLEWTRGLRLQGRRVG